LRIVTKLYGDVAQLAERYLCKVKDVGSSPIVSTKKNKMEELLKHLDLIQIGLNHINCTLDNISNDVEIIKKDLNHINGTLDNILK
jgi:hypothetical protein